MALAGWLAQQRGVAGHDLQLEYERYRNELVDAMTVIETDLDRRRRKLGSGRPPTGAGGRDVSLKPRRRTGQRRRYRNFFGERAGDRGDGGMAVGARLRCMPDACSALTEPPQRHRYPMQCRAAD